MVSAFKPAGESNVRSSIALDDNTVLIGTEETADAYKSTDRGLIWRKTFDAGDIFDFLEMDGTLYATTKSTAKIYRSTDQGRTWSEHVQLWERGFLGTFARFDWRGREYLLLAATDQRKAGDFRHLLLISPDGGDTWKEWIELQRDNTGGASNVTVLGDHTIIVGTGNHSAQGRAFTIAIED